MTRIMSVVTASILAAAVAVPASAATMMVIPTQKVSPAKSLTAMQQIVTQSAERYKWDIVSNKPGLLALSYGRTGKWAVKVDVEYTGSQYTIKYKDSFGLDYQVKNGVADIHRNYNRWINNLNTEIQYRLKK